MQRSSTRKINENGKELDEEQVQKDNLESNQEHEKDDQAETRQNLKGILDKSQDTIVQFTIFDKKDRDYSRRHGSQISPAKQLFL